MARTGVAAGIVATAVARADSAAPSAPPLRAFSHTTVRELVRHPARYRHDLVGVSGRAYRTSRYGFVLVDGRHAIFVGASADEMRSVRSGERVRLRAEIGRMSRFRADTAARALSQPGGGARKARIDRAPAKRGSPFLILRRLRGDS
jgi:hypothetical protein